MIVYMWKVLTLQQKQSYHQVWAFLVCDCRCCGDTLDSAGKYHTFFFVVWLQKE